MRWLGCSYPDLQALPADYVPVIDEIALQEHRALQASRRARKGR